MLYVNTSIVLIDFSILDTKKYSLYIGDELCDVILEKKEGNFAYGLVPDLKADTELNRLRRQRRYSDNFKTALFGLALVSLIVSLSACMINV